jgi:hypothetical protein
MKTKYLNLLIVTIALFFSTSCIDEVLDKDPISSFSGDGFYKVEGDAQVGVYGVYDAVQGAFSQNFAYWGEGRADNVITQASATGEGVALTTNILTKTLGSSNWNGLYLIISRANYAIKYIPTVFATENTQSKQLIGQTKALRALAYFYLVRVWGNVPLITEPYTSMDQDLYVKRTDKELVLNQVEEDLKYAAENCVTTFNGTNDRIMFTKGSANGLLTQVYMWRKKYAEAVTTSSLVMGNKSLYSLAATLADWAKIFTDSYQGESIFEIGYNTTETNGLRGLYAIGGSAVFVPSTKFKSTFETGDLRIPYIYDVSQATVRAIWKYLGKGVSDESSTPSKNNIVLIRLADIMLLRAEALNKLGGTANKTEALSLLNTIRKRAGIPEFASEAEAITKYGDLENAILHERSVELCFEGHRWFDLVRTGKAISTMKPVNGLTDERNLVWPILQLNMDKNPNLVQNEFYN